MEILIGVDPTHSQTVNTIPLDNTNLVEQRNLPLNAFNLVIQNMVNNTEMIRFMHHLLIPFPENNKL